MARQSHGHKVWFFPDGDLPSPGKGPLKGHESLIMLNPNDRDAQVTVTVYYTDREAEQAPVQTVAARRVRCFRIPRPSRE